jgi:syntaxin-binding protein 5
MVSSYSPPGTVLTICSDPSLDYAFLGMQTGEVLAYDMDRGAMAPLRIPSFWKEKDPRAKVTPVMSLALHPRDIGSLLIGYAEGAVIYSFKQNAAVKFFQYELPRGAPGGDADPGYMNVIRHPRLTHAVWHPTGTFILTGHEDGSLVFWDSKDGRVVMARTLTDTNIDKPTGARSGAMQQQGNMAMKEPLFRIAWCPNQDPEDTAIIVSGGASSTSPAKGLTLFEMGRTPVYATSSWQIFSQYFESPKRQRMLPTPPNTEVIDFCLIPRSSPHFAGTHDPVAILALLASGEIVSMSFPSGYPISPTNQLHISLTFVHPFLTSINMAPIERGRWLGMIEKRTIGPLILQGGAPAPRPVKRFESRNIVITAHADGVVRLWDAGHGDDIENESVIQVDVGKAVGQPHGIEITKTSLSGVNGELAAGTASGEIAVFRWGHNKNAGREPSDGTANSRGLSDISSRVEASLSDGLLPFILLNTEKGPVTALKLSDIGFFACATKGGQLSVVDLRGPAVIFDAGVQEFATQEKRGFRRHSSQAGATGDWVTSIEFSIMTLDGDNYSSILVHAGTAHGILATFKILPDSSGRHSVQLSGVAGLDDSIIRMIPLEAESGQSAHASQHAYAGLRNGLRVNGILLAVTHSGARLFKPANGRGASKSWDGYRCESAGVCRVEDQCALVTLGSDGQARALSIPGLHQIATASLSKYMDPRRLSDAIVTTSGDVLGWTGPAETALVNVFGKDLVL